MKTRSIPYAFALLAITVSAFAQAGHPGGGPGTNPGTGNTGMLGGSRNPTQTGTFPGANTNSPDFTQNTIFVSGKVSMDDGTPPPDFVVMQLFCGAVPRSLGYTDPKGRFSINLGDRNNGAGVADVEENFPIANGPGGAGNLNNMSGRMSGPGALNGCELRANLAGFRSDTVHLFDRRAIDSPDVGTIFLHRRENVEGLTISLTTALAPGSARKAFEKGRESERKGKWEEAERQFQKAVGEYPTFAAAWYELGRTQEQLKDIEAARKSYAQALAADPKLVTPYQQLAALAANEKKWHEVAENTSHLLRLNPVDFPRAWYSNAFANYQLQNMEAAEKSARGGIAADSGHHLPQMNYLLAMILEQKQDYAGAAENLRAYLALAPKASDADKAKQQLAALEAKK